MPVELPPTPDVVIEERLAALEDPLLAERLFREHPALYLSEPPQTQRQVLAWATRRFGAVALAVTAAASLVAGYVFAPHATQRPAAPPHVAAPAQHHAAPAHRAAAPAHHAAPLTHHAAAPTHVAPAAVVVAPAVVAAPVVTHHPARAHTAYAPAIAPAVVPHLQPQTKKVPALIVTHHPAAATRPAPLAQPRTEPAAATAPATATSTATASATSTATTTAVSTVTPGAAPDPTRYDAAPMPDGTKTAPVSTGRWTESATAQGPAAPSPVDPCTPRGGRVGAIMGTLIAPSFHH